MSTRMPISRLTSENSTTVGSTLTGGQRMHDCRVQDSDVTTTHDRTELDYEEKSHTVDSTEDDIELDYGRKSLSCVSSTNDISELEYAGRSHIGGSTDDDREPDFAGRSTTGGSINGGRKLDSAGRSATCGSTDDGRQLYSAGRSATGGSTYDGRELDSTGRSATGGSTDDDWKLDSAGRPATGGSTDDGRKLDSTGRSATDGSTDDGRELDYTGISATGGSTDDGRELDYTGISATGDSMYIGRSQTGDMTRCTQTTTNTGSGSLKSAVEVSSVHILGCIGPFAPVPVKKAGGCNTVVLPDAFKTNQVLQDHSTREYILEGNRTNQTKLKGHRMQQTKHKCYRTSQSKEKWYRTSHAKQKGKRTSQAKLKGHRTNQTTLDSNWTSSTISENEAACRSILQYMSNDDGVIPEQDVSIAESHEGEVSQQHISEIYEEGVVHSISDEYRNNHSINSDKRRTHGSSAEKAVHENKCKVLARDVKVAKNYCPVCHINIQSKTIYKMHLLSAEHNSNLSKLSKRDLHQGEYQLFLLSQSKYKCSMCHFYCMRRSDFEYHLESPQHQVQHQCSTRYVCDECHYVAQNRKTIALHINSFHKKNQGKILRQKLYCHLCKFVTGWPRHLQKHLEQHKSRIGLGRQGMSSTWKENMASEVDEVEGQAMKSQHQKEYVDSACGETPDKPTKTYEITNSPADPNQPCYITLGDDFMVDDGDIYFSVYLYGNNDIPHEHLERNICDAILQSSK